MKNRLFLIFIVLSFFIAAEATKTKVSELPLTYKKWLEEEVVYIITSREREVFLELKIDRERNLFIEAFWKHRDPTPGSPKNEFKDEHYRRINYANHSFGRGAPTVGWRTDRGRIYIILGEPMNIQRFEGKSQIQPSEVWFYQGKTDVGLPPGFNLVFFQESGTGEYRLYSPIRDGPQRLMRGYEGDPTDYLAAYEKLSDLEPDLAQVSLSLIPGDSSAAFGRPSLASDMMVQKIETASQKQIEDRYAQKFLQYKDIVEVEYTANYIDSDSLVKVIKDTSGLNFVHYAIELPRLSVNFYENTYYTNLKLNGTVSDLEGKTIYQYEKNINLEFDGEQMKNVSLKPLNLHDMFLLIPGNYKFSVLVKNEVSKEFTSLERDLIIPQDDSSLQMCFLLLGYKVSQSNIEQKKPKPFRVGSYQISCQPNRVFISGDSLALVFQIHGLNQQLVQRGEVKFTFLKKGEEFRSFTRKISEYPESPNFIEEFSLGDFSPAHYRIQVSLVADGREVLFESDEFDVTHLDAIPRPWIYSRILPDIEDPFYPYIIGTQLFNKGKIDKAKPSLEEAFHKKPNSIEYAVGLAQVYMLLGEYRKIESVLLPFLSQPKPIYEVYFMMGKAYQNLGELDKALEIYDKAISRYGLNIYLLNSVGECYFRLGRLEEALSAWEKSLEINSKQSQIRKNVDTLKKKKKGGVSPSLMILLQQSF